MRMRVSLQRLFLFATAASYCALWGATARAQDNSPTASSVPTSSISPVPSPPETKALLTNFVETGGGYLTLTDGFGSWSSGYARSVITVGKDIVNAEVNGQHEFGDAGTYFAAGDTHNFSDSSYAALTIGSSAGGFFLPRFRADGFFNQKLMSRKQLVLTVGAGYYAAKDPHRDRSVFVGSTYYFAKPWILEEGVRFNISNPGTVFSPSGFVAITQGRDKKHYLTLRAGSGEEAYQLIGPATELSDFVSQTVTVTWRQWIGHSWGVNWVADYYGNPYYKRAGSTLGLFKEF